MSLMARVDGVRSRLQAVNDQLSGARGILNSDLGREMGDGFSGFFRRLGDEVSDTWDSITNPIETAKDAWAGLQEAVDDPEQALKEAWNGLKAPFEEFKEDWNEGREGEAIGQGLAEVVLLASPTKIFKGLKGLGALDGDSDDAPDVPNNPTPMPEARLEGPVPGLEGAKYDYPPKNTGSPEDRAYAERVTGNNTGLSPYVSNGERDVEFDGVELGENGEITLLEAKNAGENSIYDVTERNSFTNNHKIPKILAQAEDQVKAVNESGAKGVKWLVANEEVAQGLRDLFNERGLPITVVDAP